MYLNQMSIWEQIKIEPTENIYGDIKYSRQTIPIHVRKQEHIEEVHLPDGTVVKSKYYYYTHEDVQINDKLDGLLVVSSYDMNSLGGIRKLRRLLTV